MRQQFVALFCDLTYWDRKPNAFLSHKLSPHWDKQLQLSARESHQW